MARILVVDDQKNMRTSLAMILREAGYDVEEAGDGESASNLVDADSFDLLLTDLRMGSTSGISVLRHAKEVAPFTEVIVMTAYGTIESAVEAMRLGAYDYLQKPFSEDELLVRVRKALEKRFLAGEVSVLAAEFRARYHLENMIGRSGAIRDVLGRIIRIAPTDSTVLITGDSGTGKELVARAIHVNSKRADRPFVTVNCAAISETLLESELFGHVRGAFTGAVSARKGLFEEANGGTFFFDEIVETSQTFQVKLLRAIQQGEIRKLGHSKSLHVDVRVIAATNQNPKQAMENGAFRQDLYYRLNVCRFNLPPLRERREDIPLLVEFFLTRYAEKIGANVALGNGVLDFFMSYDFPGNVRELENMIEQGVALAENGVIPLEAVLPAESPLSDLREIREGKALQDVVDEAERAAIEKALREANGNRSRAAELLGLSPTTLWRKAKRLNIG
jgi:two-component system response regulator HydG